MKIRENVFGSEAQLLILHKVKDLKKGEKIKMRKLSPTENSVAHYFRQCRGLALMGLIKMEMDSNVIYISKGPEYKHIKGYVEYVVLEG